MNLARISSRAVLLGALALLASGCGGGDDLDKLDLSGQATFDGQPIVYGSITFTPNKSQGHAGGPQGHAEIIDGKYSTALGGEGIVAGPHLVRVTAFPKRPPIISRVEGEGSAPPPPGPKPLFIGYTMEIEINEPQQDIAVPAKANGFNNLAPTSGRQFRGA